MLVNQLISSNEIRRLFTAAMSSMYKDEVPQYARLYSLLEKVNKRVATSLGLDTSDDNLEVERHGAIRLGTSVELFNIRRLFAIMGMLPVDYYDLSVAGIPVHSTAFRVIKPQNLEQNPFRIFTSLLRLDLIEDTKLKEKAQQILADRQIFSQELKSLIKTHETNGGLSEDQAKEFILEALKVFRWHKEAKVDTQTYKELKNTHALIADIVSFKGPHINHLTLSTLDIDLIQTQLSRQDFKAKAVVEGPPSRKCPILLRQTSFLALEEAVEFSDGEPGTHTARFGEIEQRGVALTPKGRALYDKLLQQARSKNLGESDYTSNLTDAFSAFPDSHRELHDLGLAYYYYLDGKPGGDIEPILYEDFLPISAAGIFESNLDNDPKQKITQSTNQKSFEKALGMPVLNSFELYEKLQQESAKKCGLT